MIKFKKYVHEMKCEKLYSSQDEQFSSDQNGVGENPFSLEFFILNNFI